MPRLATLLVTSTLAAGLAACSEGAAPAATPTLTIRAAVQSAAPVRAAGLRSPALLVDSMLSGNPASTRIGMRAAWVSASADCSAPVLVEELSSGAPVEKDFNQSPVLFTGSPAAGQYRCVALGISDVIRFRPDSTFGGCNRDSTYTIDIYRTDNTDPVHDPASVWKDLSLSPITPSGTDASPGDDHVVLIFTTDTAAAQARGFSPYQTLPLGAPLVVPGQSTFVWGGTGTVKTLASGASLGSRTCELEPGMPSFQ